MKAGWIFLAVLVLLCAAVFQLPAQQSEADRKLLGEIRTKAEKGDAESMESLGVHYQHGLLGQVQDFAEAVRWYAKAADLGLASAQLDLGQMYFNGDGVPKSAAEAAKWYQKAADQGDAAAQSMLGMIYYYGPEADFNVTKQTDRAVILFRAAAAQGYLWGQYWLGDAFENGNGVNRNYGEAVSWYRKAAEQGASLAWFSLGLLYAKGNGVPKDYVEAYKWWALVSAGGDVMARENLEKLEAKMNRDQIAEAQRLARDFKARVPADPSTPTSPRRAAGPAASGSGFFITEDGYLVTNNHVVKNSKKIRLVTSAGLIPAEVVKVDAANDLALLKAEGRFAALPVAASRGVKLGSTVATVGFPNIGLQGFSPKLTKGEIGSLSGIQDDARYFQISVPVQPGNSGGALVDERGNVVGVVAAKLSARAALAASGSLPENVNYAVKSSFLLGFLESVPEVSAKLKEPNTKELKFEDVVKAAEQAAVLVLVY